MAMTARETARGRLTRGAKVGQGHARGVPAAGAVNASARVGRGGGQVQPAHRGAVPVVGEGRAKEELLAEASTAAAQVAAHQVFVHRFQVIGGSDVPALDQGAKAGG